MTLDGWLADVKARCAHKLTMDLDDLVQTRNDRATLLALVRRAHETLHESRQYTLPKSLEQKIDACVADLARFARDGEKG